MGQLIHQNWNKHVSFSDILKMIKGAFDFLVSDYSFKTSDNYQDNSILYCTVTYLANKIAIEPLVDIKDDVVEVYLVRLKNGIIPQGWEFDKQGHLVRVRLFAACWHRKVNSPKVTNISNLKPSDQIMAYLDAEVGTLKTNFIDILQDSDQLFIEMEDKLDKRQREQNISNFYLTAESLFRDKKYSEFIKHLQNVENDISQLWIKRMEYAKNKIALHRA